MKLIAKKPCSFGGQQFYIGDEIPIELVAAPTIQDKLGVLAIVNTENEGIPDGQSGVFPEQMYTLEELDHMVAEAVEEAVNNTVAEMQQKQAELQETSSEAYVRTFMVPVKTDDGEGDNAQYISLPMTPEGIAQVVSVIQSKANEGIQMVSDITDENILILIHALDSRVTVKNAAKKQAGTLTSTETEKNDAQDDTESTGSSAIGDNIIKDGVTPQDGDGK